MRINIDLSEDTVSKLGVLAADAGTNRKNHIENLLLVHATKAYSQLVERETKKIGYKKK